MDSVSDKVSKEDKKFLDKYADKLSNSTQYAKWISNKEEHEEHNGQSLATRNHEAIMKWAEERNAVPATVPGTEHGDQLGVLRFNFPGYGGRELKEVSWEEWFNTFDARDLVFVFQEHMKNGNQSNFFRLDNPKREDG
jgi:hypothetical protein